MTAPTNVRELVGISEAERITGLSRQTIWRKSKSGAFPLPRYVANRRVWYVDELEAWVENEMKQQAASRRGALNLASVEASL